jgi:uncharacterized protein YmfQ (DUF2313 family)
MIDPRFTQALAGLLPQGYAWPREVGSTLMAVMEGLGDAFADHHQAVHAQVRQWMPHLTTTRLAEWEASCGLPDACLGLDQTEQQRRAELLKRLRGPDLPFSDSSPAAPAVIEQLCADIGYSVTVTYNTPMRVRRDRVGSRLGKLDGRLNVFVDTSSTPLRVGSGRVGQRLVNRDLPGSDLSCYLQRIVPARYSVNIVFS